MKTKHTSIVTTVAPFTRPSLRNGFNGLLRDLPGDRAVLPPSPADRSADLTPASGCQDHTTSPSASAPFVLRAPPRPSHPAPTFVTIAKRPSHGRGMAGLLEVICPTGPANYFLLGDWTTQIKLNRLTKLLFSRSGVRRRNRLACERIHKRRSLADGFKHLAPHAMAAACALALPISGGYNFKAFWR
jgi:hypothetical protein